MECSPDMTGYLPCNGTVAPWHHYQIIFWCHFYLSGNRCVLRGTMAPWNRGTVESVIRKFSGKTTTMDVWEIVFSPCSSPTWQTLHSWKWIWTLSRVCTSFSRTILPLRTAIVNRMCENDLHDDEGFDRDIHSSLTADPAYRRSSPAGSRCFEVLVYSTTAQWNAVPAMLSIERCSRSTESQVVSFSLIHVSLYPHHTAYSGSIVPLLYYPPYACVRAIYQLRPAADPAVESRGFITPSMSQVSMFHESLYAHGRG